MRILCEISSALSYIHERNIVHRDLKLQNVLMTANGEAKVMDFGLSKMFDDAQEMTKTMRIGTSIYMSPVRCFFLLF